MSKGCLSGYMKAASLFGRSLINDGKYPDSDTLFHGCIRCNFNNKLHSSRMYSLDISLYSVEEIHYRDTISTLLLLPQ